MEVERATTATTPSLDRSTDAFSPIHPGLGQEAGRPRRRLLITALLAASLGLGTASAAVAAPAAQPAKTEPSATAAPTFDQAYLRRRERRAPG